MTEKIMVSVCPAGVFLMEDPSSGARIDTGGFTSVEKTAWVDMQVAEGALKLEGAFDAKPEADAKAEAEAKAEAGVKAEAEAKASSSKKR